MKKNSKSILNGKGFYIALALSVAMLLFLVISLFSDFFGLILGSDFRDGLFIIPVVLFANIGNGKIGRAHV